MIKYWALLQKGSSYFTVCALGDTRKEAEEYLQTQYPGHRVIQFNEKPQEKKG
jgi:hypothetical protein